ncbi:hypothetical protein QLQ86_09940 [Halomonas sp. LR5S13]|nr:hypothetical protein [Halomonas rhizosphaerae]MDI5921103.1 hypothetical protein [Halomonas rhizosphaerae]
MAAVHLDHLPHFQGRDIVVTPHDSAERYLSSALSEGRFGEQESVQ